MDDNGKAQASLPALPCHWLMKLPYFMALFNVRAPSLAKLQILI